MNSRLPWAVESIDPSVRERAEIAARRSGMSLSDWINSTLGEAVPPGFRVRASDPPALPSHEAQEVADIHQRLDSIARQIEQLSRPAPRNDAHRAEQGVARQLNDAISRLDARLSQISSPARPQDKHQDRQQHRQHDRQHDLDRVERAAAQVYRNSPPLSPASLDAAIAEIAARQNELDSGTPRPVPPRAAPPVAPAPPPGPDFSALERHLIKITSQIEALQRPDAVEQSISAFRAELAEIRHAITEAMPRRAIESIEGEIRSLSRRIDENRHSGVDSQALAGIERTLGEIRGVLQSLTPAEQLAGYDEAIRNLGAKLDLILRANDDPGTVQQLEGAIAALRAIVSNVASNDALVRVSDDVHMLSSKVDQLVLSEQRSDSFALLEQRIAALTSTLESRDRLLASESNEQLENALRALSDRLDRMPIGNDSASAFAHLEQRVSYLLDRLEASSDHRAGNLGKVEDGLHDILRHLDKQQATFAALATSNRGTADPGLIDMVRRELTDIRFNQSETDRHTQDSLETVHNALGHVVDRLAMIEGDLRAARSQPDAPPTESSPAPAPFAQATAPRVTMPPQPKPELPNPAAAQAQFVAAPRDFQPAPQTTNAVVSTAVPRAISEILEPHAAQPPAAIEPPLPPDHPLEPGTRPSARMSSPSERIAASESAISEIPASPSEKVSSSSFIAAARRAAQAAAAAPPADKSGRAASASGGKEASTITSKIRSLLVGASVVVIVLGSFKVAMTLLDGGSAQRTPAMDNASERQPQAQSPADTGTDTAREDPTTPSLTSPTPIGRQSLNAPAVNTDAAAFVTMPQATANSAPATSDVTGTIPVTQAAPPSGRNLAMVQIPPSERLPDAIGGPALRAAALKGDPTAAYEVGVRFADGKVIAPNFDEAAKWYDRAAQAGVVPAIFRLGTLYEKGLSVTKDVDIARRYYLQAAERGNAKAMHNLAVLEADGGGKGPNYKGAAQWFRKAAERGIADSQYNLGILYARGIGVEQNLAESFKWFSLAAAKGDADAARKRDDVAKRLDAESLAAARLAIQTFTPEPQPDDAVNVASPPGGWDNASPQARSEKPAAKPVLTRRAAR